MKSYLFKLFFSKFGGSEKLDLSKLCEFCIKSCAEWRKMTAVN